ncbi:hypothetical protein Tco_0996570 [Tanacetum coccineum]
MAVAAAIIAPRHRSIRSTTPPQPTPKPPRRPPPPTNSRRTSTPPSPPSPPRHHPLLVTTATTTANPTFALPPLRPSPSLNHHIITPLSPHHRCCANSTKGVLTPHRGAVWFSYQHQKGAFSFAQHQGCV